MIVGLCGLAGSGKDTAADFMVKNDAFLKIALADPLKRIAREVFDFSFEQLWGPSQMRNAPDKRYYRLPKPAEEIDRLIHKWHNEPVDVGPVDRYVGLTYEEYSCYVESGGYLTPRFALQQLGTEWGRRCYPNVWVDYAIRLAKGLLANPKGNPTFYDARFGVRTRYVSDPDIYGVVISDVRFINEIDAIQAAGGKVYKMLRGTGLTGSAGQHQSEKEMQAIPLEKFDGLLDNREWTLEDLEANVHGFAVNLFGRNK